MEVTKEWLQIQLRVDTQRVLGRALMAIYKRQTSAEQSTNATKHNNGVGFSKPDARIGGIGARQYMDGGKVQPWVIDIWMYPAKDGLPRICKYAAQLDEVRKEREASKQLEFASRYGRQVTIANDLVTLQKRA